MSTYYLGIGTTAFLGTCLALHLLTAYPDRPLEASKGRWRVWDIFTMRLVKLKTEKKYALSGPFN